MRDEGQDIERWARQLAGKSPPGEVASDIDTLRTVIGVTDQSLNDSTEADRVSYARLIKRLESEGLLSSRPRWQLLAAAAAAVLIAAIGLRVVLPPDTVNRGVAGSVTIIAEQPDVMLAQVSRQLRALGLQPRTVKEDGRLLIEVDVSQDQLEAFYAWAQARGGQPVTAGTYRIFIDGKTIVSR
jgi:hypothetical protein